MFTRIQHFFNTLKTNWSEDAAARGAAKMAAGAVLIVEGLFGVLRRGRRRSRKGGRNVGGILGGVVGIVMGIIFLNIGGFITPTPPDDAIETTGTVVDVVTSQSRDNGQMYSPVIEFQATDGQTYQFTQSGRSSSRPTEGSEVSVMYSESNPNNVHRTDGIIAYAPWAFTGAGIFIIVSSVISLAISIALIAFGVILFKQGRADRAAAGESQGFFSDLFSLVTQAREGGIDVDATAAGQQGGSQGFADALFGGGGRSDPMPAGAGHGLAGSGSAAPTAPAPAASGPGAGWYIDPDDSSLMRWWTGDDWGDQKKPRQT